MKVLFFLHPPDSAQNKRAPRSAVASSRYPTTRPVCPSAFHTLYHCSQLNSSPPPKMTKKPRMVRKMTAFPVITRPQAPHWICKRADSAVSTRHGAVVVGKTCLLEGFFQPPENLLGRPQGALGKCFGVRKMLKVEIWKIWLIIIVK